MSIEQEWPDEERRDRALERLRVDVATTCPGCGGKKSRDAMLCRSCRTRANALGVSVLTHVHEAATPAPSRPRTPQQNRVYHGKLADLARLEQAPIAALKRRVLAEATSRFNRPVTSSTDLSEVEMEQLLEWLDDQLERFA